MKRQTRALRFFLSAALVAVVVAPAFAARVTYALDPGHTQVRFNWNHLGFSNPGASFDVVTGTLEWDERDPTQSSVEVSMPVASVHSHVPKLDEDLRSPKFFDAAKYPTVTFKSRKVERGDTAHKLKITGELTAHGIT